MLRLISLAALIIAALFACGEEVPETGLPETNNPEFTAPVLNNTPIEVRVLLPSYRLRDTPNTAGNTLDMLDRGTLLTYAGEATPNAEAITLRSVRYNEPWVKVRTATGTEGWVYGGGVAPTTFGDSQIARNFFEARLRGLFGKSIAQRILNYREAYENATTEDAVAAVYKDGKALVEGPINTYLVNQLDYETLLQNDFRRPPALGWLETVLPGFTLGRVAEGTLYQLLEDDRQWLAKAQTTPGTADNGYFRLQAALYPVDSIAYGFPAYFMQTWDYGGHSNLGSGLHLQLLRDMDVAYSKGPAFQAAILESKAALLEDALTYESYWQSAEDIRAELKRILNAELDILTDADKIALEARLAQLADPTAAGIEVNKRAGE